MSGFMDMSKFLNDDYRISLADTYKGGISLTETMNRSIGREISARLQSKVIEHMNRKMANWSRLGHKAYSGRTQNAQNIATIGSLVGTGIGLASGPLANKWWGSKPPTDLGTGAIEGPLLDRMHPELYRGVNSNTIA